MKLKRVISCLALVALCSPFTVAQNKRDIAVRSDKQTLSENETWIYDDLNAAIVNARETRRPLMVVFR